MGEFVRRIRQRKLVQWTLAYLTGAWVVLQVLDLAAGSYAWPSLVMRLAFAVLALGFVVMLLLAWYHGERGSQRVTGVELLLLAGVLGIGGFLIWRYAGAPRSASGTLASPANHAPTARTTPHASAPATAVSIPAESIAVLPFENLGGDKDEQYFSDGLTEDLITALSQFKGLKVISRNSSFQFRDHQDDSRAIGRKLGVARLLEGSVRRQGKLVRVSASLIRAADGSTVWSRHYDRPYADLFKLQDDITAAVAGELKAKLLGGPGAAVQSERPRSGNLAAYNAFQIGKFYADRSTKADDLKAMQHFRRAIRIDPGYAYAYAALANLDAWHASFYLGGAQAGQAYAEARKASITALQLAPDLAYAHVARGQLLLNGDLDWVGAETEFQRAVELAPGNSQALFSLASARMALGRLDSAITLARRAQALDPLNANSYYLSASAWAVQGHFDRAMKDIDKAIELQPSLMPDYYQKAAIVLLKGDHVAAVRIARAMQPGSWREVAMAQVLQVAGDPAAAEAALQKLIKDAANSAAYQIAQTYALRKDPDRMFAWLERAWSNHDPGLWRLETDPFMRPWRHDPRFAAFCRKIGLPVPGRAQAK